MGVGKPSGVVGFAWEVQELKHPQQFPTGLSGRSKGMGIKSWSVIWMEVKDKIILINPHPSSWSLLFLRLVQGTVLFLLHQISVSHSTSSPPSHLLLAPRVFIQKGQGQEEHQCFYKLARIHEGLTPAHGEELDEKSTQPTGLCSRTRSTQQ